MTDATEPETPIDAPDPASRAADDGNLGSPDRLEYDVPDGEQPVECSYCGRPFADAEFLALHRGLVHSDAIDEDERAAFERAYESESDELRLFRLKALVALVIVYFGMLMTYAVVT